MVNYSFHGKTALAAAGITALTAKSGRTVTSLAVEACRNALAAAGLDANQVDGFSTFSMYDDSVPAESVAGALGIHELAYCMDFNQGGQSPSALVMNAAMAIHSGVAKYVLLYRALNGRSGARVGRVQASGVGPAMRYPPGLNAYPQVQALWFRRHMIETGATENDLASIAINASANASLNPRAFRKKKITEADYFASPYIAEPFRRLDCTVEVDGACAVLVTSLERARDLDLAPAVITSSSWNTHRFDTDMASNLCYDDFSKNYAAYMRDRLWGMAGLEPLEVDVASLYDCFTGVLLQNIEAYGLAGRGEGGEYVRRQAKDPKLPKLNPSGGLLCEGYLHGMNVLAEAVWQVQGVAGPTQKPGARTAVTCSAGGISGSALVLTRDSQRSGGA